jgi:hypothetical protein
MASLRRERRRRAIAPILMVAIVPALVMFARSGATPVAAACDGSTVWQQDSEQRVQNWYMHMWLEDFDDNSCRDTGYGFGADSRYSWGGNWHNVTTMAVHGRVWVCGGLREDDTLTQSNTAYTAFTTQTYDYHDPNGPTTGSTCGHQADSGAHYEVPNQFKWDTYLALDHNAQGWTHKCC